MIVGYFYAFLVSLLFSLYIVPRKFSKMIPSLYVMFVGLGFFVPSVVYLVSTLDFSSLLNPILLLSILVGVVWMVASVLFTIAIDKLGMSRSNQWKNLQGPIGVGLSLMLLSEYQTTNVLFVVLAIIAIFVSAVCFSIRKDTEKVIDKTGIWFAIAAGVLYGANSVIQKYVTINVPEIAPQQFYFSMGVFVSALVYFLIKNKSAKQSALISFKGAYLPILAGVLYFIASQFSIMANKIIPNSIAFTIIQFNAFWTVLIGILVFKEIDMGRHWKRVSVGMVFALLSILVIFFGMK